MKTEKAITAVVMLAMVVPQVAQAGAPEAFVAAQAALVTLPAAKDPQRRGGKATSPEEMRATAVRRYTDSMDRLMRMLEEGLALSAEQKTAIDKMVKAHVAAAAANKGKKDRTVETQSVADDEPVGLPGLRKQWEANRADGRPQSGAPPHVFVFPVDFLVELSFQLKEDQLDAYEAIINRWKVLRPPPTGDGPIRQILRAIMDPGLDIPRLKRFDLRKHVMAEMRKLGAGRRDQKKRALFCVELRKQILAQLEPPQQAHFTKTVEQLAKDAERFQSGG